MKYKIWIVNNSPPQHWKKKLFPSSTHEGTHNHCDFTVMAKYEMLKRELEDPATCLANVIPNGPRQWYGDDSPHTNKMIGPTFYHTPPPPPIPPPLLAAINSFSCSLLALRRWVSMVEEQTVPRKVGIWMEKAGESDIHCSQELNGIRSMGFLYSPQQQLHMDQPRLWGRGNRESEQRVARKGRFQRPVHVEVCGSNHQTSKFWFPHNSPKILYVGWGW